MRLLTSAAVVLLSVVLCVECNTYQLQRVASGFTWAENLIFDGNGNLFVTDATRGELWRICKNSNNSYVQSLHVSGMKRFLGLAMSTNHASLYAIAESSKGDSWVLAVDPAKPETFKTIATLPKLGNGLAIDYATGYLYTASEGDFLPLNGAVYRVNPSTGEFIVFAKDLYATDGAWIDQERGLLYVSEVITSTVLVFNVTSQEMVNKFRPSDVSMLDDYTLNSDGRMIYGADFWSGNVVCFDVTSSSSNTTILMRGFKNPTSARFGSGPGFSETSLFVTEGGGLSADITTNRSVWEILNVI